MNNIDWNQYLSGLQTSMGTPDQPSLFRPTGWSDLASFIKLIGVGIASSRANKQNKILSMLAQAKEFGVPGLRKLYSDPEFQSLAKSLPGFSLTPLPPETPEELMQTREEALLQEAEKTRREGILVPATPDVIIPEQRTETGARVSRGQPTEPDIIPEKTTPGIPEHRLFSGPKFNKLYNEFERGLVSKYGAATAEAAGLIPKTIPGVQTAIARGMMDMKASPGQVLTAIYWNLYNSGQDMNNIPPDLVAEIQSTVNPMSQAYYQNLLATGLQKIASAKLSDQRRITMAAELKSDIAKIDAQAQQAISAGHLNDARTLYTNTENKWLPTLDQLKVDEGAARINRDNAYAKYIESDIPLHQAQTDWYHARTEYTRTLGGSNSLAHLKARESSLGKLINADLRKIQGLQSATPTESFTQEDIDAKINDTYKELDSFQKQLNVIQQQEGSPDVSTFQTDYSHASQKVQQVFNYVLTKSKGDANTWVQAFNLLRKNPHLQDQKVMSPEDWNTLWHILQEKADDQGVTLPESPTPP